MRDIFQWPVFCLCSTKLSILIWIKWSIFLAYVTMVFHGGYSNHHEWFFTPLTITYWHIHHICIFIWWGILSYSLFHVERVMTWFSESLLLYIVSDIIHLHPPSAMAYSSLQDIIYQLSDWLVDIWHHPSVNPPIPLWHHLSTLSLVDGHLTSALPYAHSSIYDIIHLPSPTPMTHMWRYIYNYSQ